MRDLTPLLLDRQIDTLKAMNRQLRERVAFLEGRLCERATKVERDNRDKGKDCFCDSPGCGHIGADVLRDN